MKKLHTRITVPCRYSSDYECDTCLKTMEDMLYNVVIGQEIKLIHEGKQIYAKVIGVSDSVYDDAIYRYIEVVVVNVKI